jgi:hypothetical protein
MAATTPQYQKTTNFDLPPGTVLLGSITRNPKYPDEALNQGEIVPIIPTPTPLIHPNWKAIAKNVKQGNIGFWARIVHTVSMGGEAGASANNTSDYDYSFEKLETVSFYPNQAYLDKAIETPQMKMYLKGAGYQPVYMVTGVKVVRGPNSTVKTNVVKAREAHANLGMFATVFGFLVNLGPEAKGSTQLRHEVSFGGPSAAGGLTADSTGDKTDFVIGYRLRVLTFQEKDGEQTVDSEYYLEGDMMGDDSDTAEDNLNGSGTGMVVVSCEDAADEEAEWDRSD